MHTSPWRLQHSISALMLCTVIAATFPLLTTGCAHRVYNQESQENAYLSFLKVPSVRGSLLNQTGLPLESLELRAFWDCDYIKNAVIFKAPGDCGSEEKDLPLDPDGSFTTPAYLNFKTSLNPSDTDVVQTVRFVVGIKTDPQLSARSAITATFATGEKVSFRTDAGTTNKTALSVEARRVGEIKTTPNIMSKLTVFKLKPVNVSVHFSNEKSLNKILKSSEKIQLKLLLQFRNVPEPFRSAVQSLDVAALLAHQTSPNTKRINLALPAQLILVPGSIANNPSVNWKLTLDNGGKANGQGTLENLNLELQVD